MGEALDNFATNLNKAYCIFCCVEFLWADIQATPDLVLDRIDVNNLSWVLSLLTPNITESYSGQQNKLPFKCNKCESNGHVSPMCNKPPKSKFPIFTRVC